MKSVDSISETRNIFDNDEWSTILWMQLGTVTWVFLQNQIHPRSTGLIRVKDGYAA
jgi:hypothetical protein